MADLKTNYVDDVLDTSVNEKRKYNMIQNADGTVSFDDVTTYTQNGDTYGSNDVNETNEAVNALNNSLKYYKDETVIGTFLGKPLYRKIVNISGKIQIQVNTWNPLNIIIDNIDELVKADNTVYPGTVGFSYNNGLQAIASIPNIVIGSSHNIVVEYTKITD